MFSSKRSKKGHNKLVRSPRESSHPRSKRRTSFNHDRGPRLLFPRNKCIDLQKIRANCQEEEEDSDQGGDQESQEEDADCGEDAEEDTDCDAGEASYGISSFPPETKNFSRLRRSMRSHFRERPSPCTPTAGSMGSTIPGLSNSAKRATLSFSSER
jgi:hypothetical protein